MHPEWREYYNSIVDAVETRCASIMLVVYEMLNVKQFADMVVEGVSKL